VTLGEALGDESAESSPAGSAVPFLTGGGELGALMRAHAWGATSLGVAERWPQSLRTATSILLNSAYPMFLAWGPQKAFVYNDAYAPILGSKHPAALGQPFERVWPEIWPDLVRLVERALSGEATYSENLPLLMERSGYVEETYFTFSYSPIRDESGAVGGMFCACTETTHQVLSERRLEILTALGAPAAACANTVADAEEACVRILGGYPSDVAFACLYRLDSDHSATLVAASGTPPIMDRNGSVWPMKPARAGEPVLVEDVVQLAGESLLVDSVDAIRRAVVVPLPRRNVDEVTAVLVLGINPRRVYDGAYREFFERVSAAVAAALANARAFEIERNRVQMLADLDRAKTAFFSNVSHEFRTPLTLLLGPLEDLLQGPMDGADRSRIALAHRNARRLLRLVNALLDFSRLEAGRLDPKFQRTDVATYTSELASNFESVFAKADLRFDVDCEAPRWPVYVDRSMYEKIVLNLISNAFKYTKEGGVEVRLREREEDGYVDLIVADTGVGIPASDVPRIFERFHRVEGQQGRTHEGSGIGLALVQELAHLHGGKIDVASEPGHGSTFVVSIPVGCSHLPEDRIVPAGGRPAASSEADAYVDEVLRWLPAHAEDESELTGIQQLLDHVGTDPQERATVLLADDNADMRAYLRRLLSVKHHVEAVDDGQAGLEAVRRSRPDLIVTDAMMPRLDGFGLLRAIRADPQLADIPVVMLSARAGEVAGLEGRLAGADDYVVKPFSARELLVRVDAVLDSARLRRSAMTALRESEERFRQMADCAPVMIWTTDEQGQCTYLNRRWFEFTGQTEPPEARYDSLAAVHPEDSARMRQAFEAANATRQPFELEYRLRRSDGEYRWAIDAAAPRFGGDGRFLGYVGSVIDITDRRKLEQYYRTMAEALPQLVWTALPDGSVSYLSPQWLAYTGLSETESLGAGWIETIHPEDREDTLRHWTGTVDELHPYDIDQRIRSADGSYRWFKVRATPVRNEAGRIVYWFGTCTDIQDIVAAREMQMLLRQRLEQEVEQRTRERDQFWRVSKDLLVVVADIDSRWLTVNPAWEETLGWSEEELIGSVSDRLVHPEDRAATRHQAVTLRRGERIWRFENRLRHRDGSYRWLSWSAVPDADRIYAVARDVTPEKAAAEELAHAQEALRQAQKMEAIGQLTGGIAHDFNNLLTIVIGNIDTLRRKLPEAIEPRLRRAAENAMEGARRAASLTQQLLAFSRRQPLNPRPIDVNRLVTSLSEILQRTLGEQITVATRLEDGLRAVEVDANHLESALLNLAVNARDAMPEGGMVRIETTNVTMHELIKAGFPDAAGVHWVVIQVIDTGKGMTAEEMEHAFEPFFTTKPVGHGTGLGLSQVYGFVTQSGGHVELRSVPGAGTTVSIYLPGLEREPVDDEIAAADVLRLVSPAKVLLVEDEPQVREFSSQLLRELGYEVHATADAAAALEYLYGGAEVDLLFTDVGLPGMNGRQLADEARRRRPGLRVLFTTGYARDAIAQDGRLEPGVELIAKPFTIDELAARVAEVMERPQRPH